MAVTGFELHTAPSIVFGSGARSRIASLARPLGQRVLLVTGGASLEASGERSKLLRGLTEHGMTAVLFSVTGEPDVATVDAGALVCTSASCDLVIAVGGGSVLDTAKAIAAVAPNGGSALDYLEGLPSGGAKPIVKAPLPMVAVPTTAGSGSEVTKNAVLRVPEAGLKRSIRSDLMIPRVAVVDPELSRGAPRSVSMPAALDALTHLLEAYVSRGAHPTTDVLAREGLRRSFAALLGIARCEDDPSAASELALASLWGGIVLANAGLGAVHGLVAPLGGQFPIPHGCGCAALLAPTVRVNVLALETRAPDSPALLRYAHIASIVVGPTGRAHHIADALDSLRSSLGALPLAHYGVTESTLAPIIAGARGGSMKSNPIVLTDLELESILKAAL